MRTSICLFLLILFFNPPLKSQWETSANFGKGLIYDLEFITNQFGYAYCWPDDGSIFYIYTTDQGESWEKLNFPENETGFVQFLDENIVFLLSNGRLFKSIDRGENWNQISTILNVNYKVMFLSETVGYAFGHNRLLKTVDGTNFSDVTPEFEQSTNAVLNNFYFKNELEGFCLGGDRDDFSGFILKTIDGGENWVYKYTNNFESYEKVHFIDDDHAIAIGCIGSNVETFDNGETWSLLDWGVPFTVVDVSNVGPDLIYVVGTVATGGGMPKNFSCSSDGGITWTSSRTPISPITSVEFVNENVGFIINTFYTDSMEIFKTSVGCSSVNNTENKNFILFSNQNIIFFRNFYTRESIC